MLGRYVRFQIWVSRLRERAREERAASAVEYGVLLALIAAVIIVVVGVLGSKVSNAFESANAIYP